MRRRSFLGAAGAALAGCRRKIVRREIVIAASPYITMAPLYVAIEERRFEKAGLDVKLERVSGTGQALPLLAGGKLDVAFLTLSAGVINAVLRGARMRIAAGREHALTDCGDPGSLLVRRKSFPNGLQDLKELKGKRISVAQGAAGMSAFWTDLILESAGLKITDLKTVVASRAEEIAALASGRMDGAITSAGVELLRHDFAKEVEHVSVASRVAPGFQYSFIYFGSRLLDGGVETGARFLRVYQGAVRDFADGSTPRFLREFSDSNGYDYEAVRKRCRTSMSQDGAIDLNSVQRFLDWASEKGFSDRPAKAEEMVDMRFLDASRRPEG